MTDTDFKFYTILGRIQTMNRQFQDPVNGRKAEKCADKQDRNNGRTLTHPEGFLLVSREKVRK